MITLPWAIGIVFFLFSANADQAIAVREQIASGIVKTHEPSNHDRYGYQFTVNGRSYRGWQIPTKREFIIGEKVAVYYDPLDPAKSSLSSFAGAWDRILGPVLLMAFGIIAITAYILIRKQSIRNRSVV